MKSLYFVLALVLVTNSCLAVAWNGVILNGFSGIILMVKKSMEKDGSSSRDNEALNRLENNVNSLKFQNTMNGLNSFARLSSTQKKKLIEDTVPKEILDRFGGSSGLTRFFPDTNHDK